MDYTNKTVLITGGTGSFGSAYVKRVLKTNIAKVRIFSRDENKQHHMRQSLHDSRIEYIIGDIRDPNSIMHACHGIDYLFHAAALKQVPSCEFFPMEAVKTNIEGSQNVMEAAIANKVKKVVCLSSDKAAYPVNAMGMTKALMEKTLQAKSALMNENQTILSLVRYGNVMCSRGSVIEVFIQQILENKPITITSDEMTRFMVLLEDALNLVEYAMENAKQGDLFIHKAPACKLQDLATAILNLFKSKSKVETIGVRLGEKLHEVLASSTELAIAEDIGDYYRIPNSIKNQGGSDQNNIAGDLQSNMGDFMTLDEIKDKLLSIDYVQSALEGYLKR